MKGALRNEGAIMRRSVRTTLAVLMSLGLVVAGASTSQAVLITLSNSEASCTASASKPTLAASAAAYACAEVQVYIKYNRTGKNYYNYGEQAGFSYAESGTSTVVGRGVRAQLGPNWSGWKTY